MNQRSENEVIRGILLLTLGVAALWDVATTIIGTYKIVESETFFAIVGSAIFGLFIMTILSMTFWIFGRRNNDILFIMYFFRLIWLFCLFYDLFTSWAGNEKMVFGGSMNDTQFIIAIGLTLFMSFSPIAWMYVYDRF